MDDCFALLSLDLDCDDPARIREAVARKRTQCAQGAMVGLEKAACAHLLARLPEIERTLLNPAARRRARESARRLRSSARTERLEAFHEDLAMVLAGGRESITAPERDHLVKEHSDAEGPTAAELSALITVPIVAEAPRAAEPLPAYEAKEIAKNLAVLGKADLYEFLELPQSASAARITTRRKELLATWDGKARASAERSAAQALLGRVGTLLLDPGKRIRYAATLRTARFAPLQRALELALLDRYLSLAEHENLLARAKRLGIAREEAEQAILAAAAVAGAVVEATPAAAARPTPAPAAARPKPAAAKPKPAATRPTPAPAGSGKLIATFDATTGWAGRTITYEQGCFTLSDHGPISAADVLSCHARGYLSWAHEGLREWVVELVSAGSTETPTGKRVAVGDPYQGGTVAYILQPGDPGYVAGQTHGLIAATADQTPLASRTTWAIAARQSTLVPGGTGAAIGTGSANTIKIIAQNGAGSTHAACLARAHNGGGYSDWYLPSKDELSRLYLNRAAVRGFSSAGYWSSSEYDAIYAWGQYFVIGYQGYDRKSSTYRVRAVRSF